VVVSREVYIAFLFIGIDNEESNSILVMVRRGFRVESNLALCGLLNGHIGVFVALNFGNKSLSHVSCCDLLL
jgi:hypothetical protein